MNSSILLLLIFWNAIFSFINKLKKIFNLNCKYKFNR